MALEAELRQSEEQCSSLEAEASSLREELARQGGEFEAQIDALHTRQAQSSEQLTEAQMSLVTASARADAAEACVAELRSQVKRLDGRVAEAGAALEAERQRRLVLEEVPEAPGVIFIRYRT